MEKEDFDMNKLLQQKFNEQQEQKKNNSYGFEQYAHLLQEEEEEEKQQFIPNNSQFMPLELDEHIDVQATRPIHQVKNKVNYYKQVCLMALYYGNQTRGVPVPCSIFDSKTQKFITRNPKFH